MKYRLIIAFFFALFSLEASVLNLRKCILTPVTDSVGGALGFAVYQKIEQKLLNVTWCQYRHNSEILNILNDYSKEIRDHLHNREVLQLLGEKSKSGSVIRVDVAKAAGQYTYLVDVIDANTAEIVFSQKGLSESDAIELLVSQIMTALHDYSKEIPYDGLITGVLGDQFTTDIPNSFIKAEGSRIEIYRPNGVKKHPLFNQVVEWHKEDVA